MIKVGKLTTHILFLKVTPLIVKGLKSNGDSES